MNLLHYYQSCSQIVQHFISTYTCVSLRDGSVHLAKIHVRIQIRALACQAEDSSANRASVRSRQLSLVMWVIARVVLASHWCSEMRMRCKWLFESIFIHLFEKLQQPITVKRGTSFSVTYKGNLKRKLARHQLDLSLSCSKRSITDSVFLHLLTQRLAPAARICRLSFVYTQLQRQRAFKFCSSETVLISHADFMDMCMKWESHFGI